jgi:hypothetical protein
MPYFIKKVKNGYKVCKRDDPSICFSKHPLTREQAIKQERAIILSEFKGGANSLNMNGVDRDTTGMPADVIAKLPQIDNSNYTTSLYRRMREIYDWKVDNLPDYKAKEILKQQQREQTAKKYFESPEFLKRKEDAAKFDVSTLFNMNSKGVKSWPFPDIPMSTNQKNQYDYLFETMRKMPSILEIRAQKVKEWNDEMRRRQNDPTNKFFQSILDPLIWVADNAVKVASYIGVPPVVTQMYKSFAPPGSEYYTEGDLGDKAVNFGVNVGVNAAKKLVGLGHPNEMELYLSKKIDEILLEHKNEKRKHKKSK